MDGLLFLSSSFNPRLLFLNMSSAACSLCTNILDAALRRLHCQAAFEKKLPVTGSRKGKEEAKATTDTYCMNTSCFRDQHCLNKHSEGRWTGWWERALPTHHSSYQQPSWAGTNWHSSPDTKTQARASTNPWFSTNWDKKCSKQHFYYWHYTTLQNSPNTHVLVVAELLQDKLCGILQAEVLPEIKISVNTAGKAPHHRTDIVTGQNCRSLLISLEASASDRYPGISPPGDMNGAAPVSSTPRSLQPLLKPLFFLDAQLAEHSHLVKE